MSIPVASEKALLTDEEFDVVRATHHPAISRMSLEALHSAKSDLRERREKTRALLRERRGRARSRSGATEPSPEAKSPPAAKRKQVFAQALKRVNHELHRRNEPAHIAANNALAAPPTQRKRDAHESGAASPDAKTATSQNVKRRRKAASEDSEVRPASKTTKARKAKADG
jgi:hypothetical protein